MARKIRGSGSAKVSVNLTAENVAKAGCAHYLAQSPANAWSGSSGICLYRLSDEVQVLLIRDFLFPVLQFFTWSTKYQSCDVLTPPFLWSCAPPLHSRLPRSCVLLGIQTARDTHKAKPNGSCCIPSKWTHAIFKSTFKNAPNIPRGNKLTMCTAAWNNYTDSSERLA